MIRIKKLEKNIYFWFLVATSLVFFFLRFPSLFEPYWYGDEGIYHAIGMAINNGALLYRDTFDNKPPALYILYALFNSNQETIRLFSLITGLGSILAFFLLAKKLFTRDLPIFVSTFFFAVIFGLPVFEGNIANAENFIIPVILIGALLIVKSTEEKKSRSKILFLSGIVMSVAFLFKIIAIFDFAAFFVFLMFVSLPEKIDKNFIKSAIDEVISLIPLLVGFISPVLLVGAYFFINGAFMEFMKASLLNMVGYVGYGNKLLIPQGFLILKLSILGIFLLILLFKRNFLRYPAVYFILIWFGFSMFNAFFSQRPYTHYVLALVPAFSLLVGLVLWNKRIFKITLLLLIISYYLIVNNFWVYDKILPYYGNFISFMTNQKSVEDYRKYFDRKTIRDYDLANYIKMNTTPNDSVYLWGNNAQVYRISDKPPIQKYTVAYHVTGYEDGRQKTEAALRIHKPKFIIIMNDVPAPHFSLMGYTPVINLQGALVYERIF